MKEWMVRHPDMTFTRPMPESEIIAKIESGEITAQDEISPATGYWFSIQEVEEVKLHFGDQIVLQALIPTGSDTTSSTNTALLAKTPKPAAKAKPAPSAPVKTKPVRVQVEQEEEVSYTAARLAFGFFLAAIFVGTLSLLWLGSR